MLTVVSAVACEQSNENNLIVKYQKEITRISQFSSELPENYEIIDFKSKALAYDSLVFDFNATGTFFPLIWSDNTYNGYGISAYIGDYRNGMDGSQEAVTSLAAVLSSSLLGIDKSNQNGQNFVQPLNIYFNQEENVVINNPSGNSRNISMWYMIYPSILFSEVSILYPNETLLRQNTLKTIESWYQAYLVMHDMNSFDFTGFDFAQMQPYRNNIWREPDSAVGISLLMYYGYNLTGDEKYKTAAINSLEYIDSVYSGSPMYEILLYYGPYLASKYNVEFGTNFDVHRLFNAVFNGNSVPRGGWGMLNDNYSGYAVTGLMGSITDGGGYAFSMNTFASAFIMAKTAKYDTRYASSIGKWMNHLISNSRYYFPDQVKNENQSMYNSEYASEAQAFNTIAQNIFPYEGIRKADNNRTPWFGGDPTVYNWAQTDFSVYSGASMGMLASLYETTNVEGILKIDLNQGDYYNDTYSTYLIYNPNDEVSSVNYVPKSNNVDLYDSVTEKVIKSNVTGQTSIDIKPKDSVIIVEIPANSTLTVDEGITYLDDIVLSKSQVTLHITNYSNNDEVRENFVLTAESVFSNQLGEVAYYEVVLDGQTKRFETNKLALQSTKGSKTLIIRVFGSNGLYDQISLRLRII